MGEMVAASPAQILRQVENDVVLQWAPALVERHTRFATTNLAAARDHLRGLNTDIGLSVPRPEDFIGYREVSLAFGKLLLTMGCINATYGYDLAFRSGDEYLITLPLCGNGWISADDLFVEYGEGDIMIVAPSCDVSKHWEGPGQTLSVHVPADLFDAATKRLGIERLAIAPFMTIGQRRPRSFLRIIDMICRDLQDGPDQSPLARPPFSGQLEVLLLDLLLETLGADAAAPAAATTSNAAPYYVRRAEAFIASSAHRDIGVEDMATAAGVCERTIQYGFRKYRDTTPMLHLKRVRYDRARQLLLRDGARQRRIGDIAAEIGCPNISQFSRDYRLLFGETPSQTIAAPRRMVV